MPFAFISSYNREPLPCAVKFMILLTVCYRNSAFSAFDLRETHLSVHQCPLASWMWQHRILQCLTFPNWPGIQGFVQSKSTILQHFLEKVDKKTQMRPCFTVWLSLCGRVQGEHRRSRIRKKKSESGMKIEHQYFHKTNLLPFKKINALFYSEFKI